jgi:hypothetical protein
LFAAHARSIPLRITLVLVALALPAGPSGCGLAERPPPRSAGTRAVDAKAGDFADYWAEVLRLSRRHAAHPDSFRMALDALPGSHLTDDEWAAWTAPYEGAPGSLARSLEEAMATVAPAE